MERVPAVLVRELARHGGARDPAPIALYPCERFMFEDGSVSALADDLSPVRRRPVELPPEARLLAARPDLSCVVAATASELILCGDHTRRIGIEAADSCA
jgi:hypothetical protein